MARPRGFILRCCICGRTMGFCLAETVPAFLFCAACTNDYAERKVRGGDAERAARLLAAGAYGAAVVDHNEKGG